MFSIMSDKNSKKNYFYFIDTFDEYDLVIIIINDKRKCFSSKKQLIQLLI